MSSERILVVEDDRMSARQIELQLIELGYVVVAIAETGAEAIDKTRTYSPDLLLMNIDSGREMESIETARIIMQKFHIPVIFLTTRENQGTLSSVLENRPHGYVNKPPLKQELRTTISLALTRINPGGDTAKVKATNIQQLWQVKFTCNSDGKITRIHHGSKKTLLNMGVDNYQELFPDSHEYQIRQSVVTKKPRIIFKKRKEEIVCCEYAPLTDNVINISITGQQQHDVQDNSESIGHEFLLDILDRLTAAIILFNEQLNIIYNNRSAESLLRSGTCLGNYSGYLTCQNPEITAEFKEMVRDKKDHLLSIDRGEEQKALNVLVTPLKSSNVNSSNDLPTTILFAFEISDDYSRIEEVIRNLYHLSPMEARLVAQLFITPQLATAATALGITLNTARTHLKRIYSKTRVNRISSLIHLIVTGPASVILNTCP